MLLFPFSSLLFPSLPPFPNPSPTPRIGKDSSILKEFGLSILTIYIYLGLRKKKKKGKKMADAKKSDTYSIDMDRLDGKSPPPQPRQPAPLSSKWSSPAFPILSYCGSSILMTVTNKYVLSGLDFNLNFFLLCVQVRTLFEVSLPSPRYFIWSLVGSISSVDICISFFLL